MGSIKDKDHKRVKMEEFESAFTEVMLKRVKYRIYENRRPSMRELLKRWRLVRR